MFRAGLPQTRTCGGEAKWALNEEEDPEEDEDEDVEISNKVSILAPAKVVAKPLETAITGEKFVPRSPKNGGEEERKRGLMGGRRN